MKSHGDVHNFVFIAGVKLLLYLLQITLFVIPIGGNRQNIHSQVIVLFLKVLLCSYHLQITQCTSTLPFANFLVFSVPLKVDSYEK
jgi:hypothetical protein